MTNEELIHELELVKKRLDKLEGKGKKKDKTKEVPDIEESISESETSLIPNFPIQSRPFTIGEWEHTPISSYYISSNWSSFLDYMGFTAITEFFSYLTDPHTIAYNESNIFNQFLLMDLPWKYPVNTYHYFNTDEEDYIVIFLLENEKFYFHNGFMVSTNVLACPLGMEVTDDSPPPIEFYDYINKTSRKYLLDRPIDKCPKALIGKHTLACQLNLLPKLTNLESVKNLFFSPEFQKSLVKFCSVKGREVRRISPPGLLYHDQDERIGFSNIINTESLFPGVLDKYFYPLGKEFLALLRECLWNIQSNITHPHYHTNKWSELVDFTVSNIHEKKRLKGSPLKENLKTKGVYLSYTEKRQKPSEEDLGDKLPLPLGEWEQVSHLFD